MKYKLTRPKTQRDHSLKDAVLTYHDRLGNVIKVIDPKGKYHEVYERKLDKIEDDAYELLEGKGYLYTIGNEIHLVRFETLSKIDTSVVPQEIVGAWKEYHRREI